MNTKNNISDFEDDDLSEMAPHLSGSDKISPFKADDNYFDSFTSKLENRITDLEDIKSEAPVLINIPIFNTFETPGNYFDEFPTRIQKAVLNKGSETSIWEWLEDEYDKGQERLYGGGSGNGGLSGVDWHSPDGRDGGLGFRPLVVFSSTK